MSDCPAKEDVKILVLAVIFALFSITLIVTHSLVFYDAVNDYPENDSETVSITSFTLGTVVNVVILSVCSYYIYKKSKLIHACKSGYAASI